MKLVLFVGFLACMFGLMLVAFGVLASTITMAQSSLCAIAFAVFGCFFAVQLGRD